MSLITMRRVVPKLSTITGTDPSVGLLYDEDGARCGCNGDSITMRISRRPQAMVRKHRRWELTVYQRLKRRVDHGRIGVLAGFFGNVVR